MLSVKKTGFLWEWQHPLALHGNLHLSQWKIYTTPVLELPRPIVYVAVNEYPPFVYKINHIGEEGCAGRLVPC